MALGKNVFAIAIRNETETEAEWEEKVTAVSLCFRLQYCQSCQFSQDDGFCGKDDGFLAKMKDFLLFLCLRHTVRHVFATCCNVYIAY